MAAVTFILDFVLKQGEFTLEIHERIEAQSVSLFGASGTGKTTVLEAIAGLRHPGCGRIEVGGRVLFDDARGINLPPQSRRIGYVPQDVALFPHMSVQRNVMYGTPRGTTPREGVVALLEIKPLLDRRVEGLSGGERQRVAIARALMSNPDLLLLDEPLAAVDAKRRDRILRYIQQVRDDLRVPMVYVSHAAAEVQRIADSVISLDGGRVLAS